MYNNKSRLNIPYLRCLAAEVFGSQTQNISVSLVDQTQAKQEIHLLNIHLMHIV